MVSGQPEISFGKPLVNICEANKHVARFVNEIACLLFYPNPKLKTRTDSYKLNYSP